jgi:copper(I)-binding protein
MNRTAAAAIGVLMSLAAAAASAQTTVKDAWIRGTVAQQKATGMFAQISSVQGSRLVGVSSPVAGVAEVHEMAMEGNVMKMRALADGLALPAGQTVELKPGGYHVMLMDLKQPLEAGSTVPVTLVFEGADKKRDSVELQVPVKAMNAAMPAMKHSGH